MSRLILIAALLAALPAHAVGKKSPKGKGGGTAPTLLLLDCPLGADLVCPTGETLTFTRTGTGATCMATGLSEDTLVSVGPAENVPCFNDVHGVRIVGAIKNELCASETFDDSVVGCDWLGVTMPATVTLDQDDAPLVGVDTLADKITDDDGVLAERVRQSVALALDGKYRESVWLRDTAAHTASLQVEADTAVTPTTQTCNVSVLTTYKRFDCVLDATGLTFANVETRIYPTVTTDGALTDDVFAWGAQLQGPGSESKGEHLVPYCRSLGAAATTCAQEVLSVASAENFRNAGGDVAFDFTPMYAPTTSTSILYTWFRTTGNDAKGRMIYRESGQANIRSTDSVSSTITLTPSAWPALTTRRVSVDWQGGARALRDLTNAASTIGPYSGAWLDASITNLYIGSGPSGPSSSFGYHKHLQIYSKPTTRSPAYTALLDCSLQSDLTCASGDSLTFTAATPRPLCPSTGDEDTHVTEPGANEPCFDSSCGVWVRGAIRNELQRSEAICTSPWVSTNLSDCVSNVKDSPRSGVDALAEEIIETDAANAGNSNQTFTTATPGTYRGSVWWCANTAHAVALKIETVGGGAESNTCETTAPACGAAAPFAFDRFDCAVTNTGTPTSVRVRIYPTDPDVVAETGQLYLFGAQLQGPASGDQGKFLAPYCPSTGAGATTCAAEALTASETGNINHGGGSWSADVTPLWNPEGISHPHANIFQWGNTGNDNLLYSTLDSALFATHDGTTGSTVDPTAWLAMTTRSVSVSWRNTRRKTAVPNGSSAAFDGNWFDSGSALRLGNSGGSVNRAWACLKNWRIENDANPLP